MGGQKVLQEQVSQDFIEIFGHLVLLLPESSDMLLSVLIYVYLNFLRYCAILNKKLESLIE
jgi:hypothetical protein